MTLTPLAPRWAICSRALRASLAAVVMLATITAIVSAADEKTDKDSLASALKLYRAGHYSEAEAEYAKLAGKEAAAALGVARCQFATGKWKESTATLTAAAKNFPKSAAILGETAIQALERGEQPAAETAAAAAIELDKNELPAHWVQAELLRLRGQIKEANQAYRWFVDYYNDQDVKDPDSLRLIGLASAQFARWNRLKDQFSFLVNDLYPDALELDENYWPAHLEAGRLYLEKFNQAEATKELKAAVAINANAAEVHAALAELALQRFDLSDAGNHLDRALEINPKLIAAHQLRADIHFANVEAQKALEVIKGAVLLDPHREETLARVAAAYMALDNLAAAAPPADSRLGKLIAEVTQRNPHAGSFFETLGDGMDHLRRYPAAAYFYEQAVKSMPELTAARGRWGLMLMRLGDEEQAEKLLKESFDIDPFNVRVSNTLQVLEVLSTYETLETEHFRIKFDPKKDKVLAKYAAQWLEEVYPQLCKQLGYTPKDKSLFEIFNRAKNTDAHGWFSARMVGLPDIHTIGACAGKMVAMQSPTDGKQGFNWARVLKHEFIHVVNLQQTNFNIPHWYTEALATLNEGYPRPQVWNELLLERLADDKLFTLETINLGFVRPKSGADWNMAYCQAELYAEYMLERFGDQALAKMLKAYGDNLTTPQAIRREFEIEPADFERGYVEHIKKIAATLKKRTATKERSPGELERLAAGNPKDADTQAEVARYRLTQKNYAEARRFADAALKQAPKHQMAAYVRARLHLLIGEPQEAVTLLEATLNKDNPQEDLLALLAGLRLRAEDYPAAAELYELGAKSDPLGTKWVKSLAAVYLKSGNEEKLTPALARLAAEDADDVTLRKKLTQLAMAKKDYATAERYSRESLQIDVLDAGIHKSLAEALLGQQQPKPAAEELAVAVELKPDDAQLLFLLATAHADAGQKQEALAALDQLKKLDAEYTGAAELRAKLSSP